MDHEQKSGTAGTIFALFVAVHLFNHVYSILGANRHLALMTSLRHVYRHFVVETILIGAVVVQIVSGLGYLWTVESRPFLCSTN